MNYQKIYDCLISRGLKRGLNKKKIDYYTEKHHIIPKCMSGDNSKENLVLLTAREHFIAHQLLVKIYKTTPNFYKLVRALNAMSMSNEKYSRVNGKKYEWIRIHCTEANKALNIGRSHKPETIEIISKKLSGSNNPMYGRKGNLSPSFGKKRSKDSNEKIWLNRPKTISQNAKDNISKGKRTSPIWQFPMYGELLELYISNPCGYYAFKNKAVSLGYPFTYYGKLIEEFKEIVK